ncbi:MAG: hypothetical protein ACPG53_07365, partial [Schleiferiaceae bacterium]
DVADVKLLQDVLEEQSKSLEIKLDLAALDTGLVDRVHDLLEMHPGKKRVKLHIVDIEEQLDIKLPVKDRKVNISKDLLVALELDPLLRPKINS